MTHFITVASETGAKPRCLIARPNPSYDSGIGDGSVKAPHFYDHVTVTGTWRHTQVKRLLMRKG